MELGSKARNLCKNSSSMCVCVKRRGCCKNKMKRLSRDKLHSEIPSRFDNRDRIVSFNFYFSIELRL